MHFSTPKRSKNTRKYKQSLTRFDAQQFIDLCKIQCTITEISHFFHITIDELNKQCEKSFGVPANVAQKEWQSDGKISLRRSQFKNAVEKNNPILQIWLGKNYLDQCEDPAKRVQEEQKSEVLKDIINAIKDV